MKSERATRIALIGPRVASEAVLAAAEAVGAGVARRGGILICGGRGGAMEAACRGAKAAGGLTIGVLPGPDDGDANPWVDVPIVTGVGEARNAIVARTAQAVIAVGGAYGTLSEIALALCFGVPVVGLGTWTVAPGDAPDAPDPIVRAGDPDEAVEAAFRLAGR